jgi:hypothetical protein
MRYGLLIPLAALVLCAGCKQSSNEAAAPSEGAAGLPAMLFLASPPANPAEVRAARRAARPGETVIVRGRVGGRKDPFVPHRAIFTIAEMALPTCTEKEGDGCATPWDYCCEPPEELRRAVATIRVVDADGQPLKTGLESVGNLKPLAEVVVEGRVASASTGEALIIDATGVFVRPRAAR